MEGYTQKEKSFVGYEYKDVTVSHIIEPLYEDSYQSFGWVLDGNAPALTGIDSVTLKFKRDRKLRNKAELTRLQHQFDACASEIESLERSKTTKASTIAYILGLVGSALMAGATFAYLGGLIPLMIILAIPGPLGWIFPYFAYRRVEKNRTSQIRPMIDEKYDEIYEVCERASALAA